MIDTEHPAPGSRVVDVPPAIAEVLDAAATPDPGAPDPSPTARTGGSGLRRTVWIELDDGTAHTVTTSVADALRYERTYKRSLFDGVGITQLVFLAWSALKRTGQTAMTYPEFEQRVADFEDVTPEDEAGDPTRPGP